MCKASTARCLSKQAGITLLEVMLALVILAVSGLSVMKAASGALNNQAYLEQKTLALWVASNHLSNLRLEKNWPGESWTKETDEMGGLTWYVRYQLVATANSDFKALDIEISDKEDGQALAYIRTYVAK